MQDQSTNQNPNGPLGEGPAEHQLARLGYAALIAMQKEIDTDRRKFYGRVAAKICIILEHEEDEQVLRGLADGIMAILEQAPGSAQEAS